MFCTVIGSTPWKLLQEALSADPESDKGEYFMAKVTLMSVRRDNPAYMACPSNTDGKTCNKKVRFSKAQIITCIT